MASGSMKLGCPQLQIRLVNDDRLMVDGPRVRACSLVASELPATAAVWDLSGLIIDGNPVTRQVVVNWLNLVYNAVDGQPYEQQPDQEGSDMTIAAALFDLLAFADSVATSKTTYAPIVARSQLWQLRILVRGLPEGFESLRLAVGGRPYYFCSRCFDGYSSGNSQGGQYSVHLSDGGCKEDWRARIAIPANPEAAIRAEVVDQVEKLLYISYKLQLEPLLQQLSMFVAASAGSIEKALIPDDMIPTMYSPRVLAAANYNEEAAKKAWILAQMQPHLNFLNGPDALLTANHDLRPHSIQRWPALSFHFEQGLGWDEEGRGCAS